MAKPLKVVSLFSGIGTLCLGLDRAGLECVYQVEIDDWCRQVLRWHWPRVRRHGDIRTFLKDAASRIECDVVVGGDPCQENSRARVTPGTVQKSLGQEFLRIVKILRPRFVIRENPSHVHNKAPWPWWRFATHLEHCGYVAEPLKVRACCFGYPHRRERMLVLAQRADTYRQPLWLPERWQASEAAALMQEEARQRQRLWAHAGAVGRRARHHADARAGGGVNGAQARLYSNSRRLRALGNAVVPEVGELAGHLLVMARS
jgi:site-specific DNA-cytosine methylase